jgi:small ligand-binding sensory domain FIST
VLKPSLRAAQSISRQSGGIADAIQRVGRYDFDVVSETVALGLGLSGRDAREVPEKVYRTGMVDLAAPVIRFLSILANGGRPAGEDGEAAEEDENPPMASA